MVRPTVIPKAPQDLEEFILYNCQGRCVCCGQPALPVLEWHSPRGEWPGYYLCHRCAQFCKVEEAAEMPRCHHREKPAFNWTKTDARWAADLGFKKLI